MDISNQLFSQVIQLIHEMIPKSHAFIAKDYEIIS